MPRPSLLTTEQIESELAQLPGWAGETSLANEFEFKNFTVAFGFMAAVATVAERMGHHPDWSNSYNTVTFGLSTHDAGGITALDVELAHEISDLAGLFQEA